MRCLETVAALLTLAAGLASAVPVNGTPEDSAGERNTIYIHPASLLAMAVVPLTDNEFVGLQLDYERHLQPHFSAVATVSYTDLSLSYDKYDVNMHIFDLLGGIRWYPFDERQGVYLSPMFGYNWSAGDATDAKKHGRLEQNRGGFMVYLGNNRRFGHLVFDWNVGLGAYYWDNTYKDTDLRKSADDPDRTVTIPVTRKLGEPGAEFLMGTPQIGANMSLGWTF